MNTAAARCKMGFKKRRAGAGAAGSGVAGRCAARGGKKIGRGGCDSLWMGCADILGGTNGGKVCMCSLGWLGARF